MEPDASLNMEEGEVIYENKHVGEWIKFWKALTFVTVGMSPGFYVFEMYNGDGVPSLSWLSDNWAWHELPK